MLLPHYRGFTVQRNLLFKTLENLETRTNWTLGYGSKFSHTYEWHIEQLWEIRTLLVVLKESSLHRFQCIPSSGYGILCLSFCPMIVTYVRTYKCTHFLERDHVCGIVCTHLRFSLWQCSGSLWRQAKRNAVLGSGNATCTRLTVISFFLCTFSETSVTRTPLGPVMPNLPPPAPPP